MISLEIWAVLVLGAVGLIVKFLLDKLDSDLEITWKEYLLGMVIIALILVPSVNKAGWEIAKNNKVTYNEFWNGWELSVKEETIPCYTNGRCRHTYSCNHHQHCTGSGDDRKCTDDHDDCPYFNYERTYSIQTTLGDFIVADRLAPANYNQEKKTWSLPFGFGPADYTVPQIWYDCKARVDSGNPGPVTKRMPYKNYLLASDTTILKQYSDLIGQLEKVGLLPSVQNKVYNFYFSDKVYFVGYQPVSPAGWQQSLMYLNACLRGRTSG